ncbi:hypothetical protein Tco_1437819 [Tanacetum coccineum]
MVLRPPRITSRRVASAKDLNVLLEQECNSLKLKVTGLESSIAGGWKKDRELSVLGASSSSLKSENQSLVDQCLNSNEYMEALGHAFGRAIEKGMQEGLAAGIEHGQAGRCLTDLEAYIPSAEDDFNSAIRDLRDLNFPLLKELSDKKDASTWDIMDLLRLDDTVAETLGMTDLQPDVNQLMVPVHHKQDRVVIGSQALSVALDICRGRVEKMERNLIERLPFLKDKITISRIIDVVPENATLGSESEGRIDASAGGGLTFSQLDDEARDAVL